MEALGPYAMEALEFSPLSNGSSNPPQVYGSPAMEALGPYAMEALEAYQAMKALAPNLWKPLGSTLRYTFFKAV